MYMCTIASVNEALRATKDVCAYVNDASLNAYCRFDWYQTDSVVCINVLVKGRESVTVEYGSKSVRIRSSNYGCECEQFKREVYLDINGVIRVKCQCLDIIIVWIIFSQGKEQM